MWCDPSRFFKNLIVRNQKTYWIVTLQEWLWGGLVIVCLSEIQDGYHKWLNLILDPMRLSWFYFHEWNHRTDFNLYFGYLGKHPFKNGYNNISQKPTCNDCF